ncbi:META domain-containing protein [Streptomyces sp. NBC_00876]|uniref:META domain-containing protein n=1 Tax=Streptomyces sp. NBC_00876 TaxID=2975853 RepID=UPI003863EDB2|nr:META domain-containing protein [Streptomyces sp. NBC_00876]
MHRQRIAVSVLALLTLAACGTEKGSGPGSGPAGGGTVQGTPSVTGVRWSVDAVTVGGKRSKAPAGAHVEIDTKGRASGSYGCNRFTAQAELDGDTLTVRPGTTTEMGCEQDIQRFETLMSRAFSGKLTATGAKSTLTLTTANGDSIALTARPAAPLTGTDWRISTLVSGSAASSLPTGTENKARITFGKDGTVHGTLGCNSFRGEADVSGSTITFGRLVVTRKTCPDPEMHLERAVLAVLDGKRTRYAIDQRTLSLTATGGSGKGLVASAAEKKD